MRTKINGAKVHRVQIEKIALICYIGSVSNNFDLNLETTISLFCHDIAYNLSYKYFKEFF